jgi:membrane-associated phospholipid phosphatase/8-oxo-dGTP pyrophosphatase MutT (NUDIX family)
MKDEKSITRLHVSYALMIFLMLTTPSKAQEFKGAACVIFVNDEIVLVRDYLSNRLSFPGGYITQGESPQQAAKRETYEETGLLIAVGPVVSTENDSAQYLCKSNQAIPILTSHGFESKPLIYALNAPHFSIEIRQVYLARPDTLKKEELRFPNQLQVLPDFSRYKEWRSHSVLLSETDIPVSPLRKGELNAISNLQHYLAPQYDLLFRLFNLAGERMGFFILIPLIWVFRGWELGIRCLILVIMASELDNVLKVAFALPRPFHVMPKLQRMEAYGFGLPSGHVLIATTFWGYCWYSLKHLLPTQKQRLSLGLVIFLLTGCALSRVYWGVHFFSDVIVGAMIGLLTLILFVYIDNKLPHHWIIRNKYSWLIGLTIISVAAFFTSGLLSSQLGGLTLGLCLGLRSGKTKILYKATCTRNSDKLFIVSLSIVGLMILDRAAKLAVSYQSSSIIAMLIYFVCHLLIGLWLTIGMYLFPASRKRRLLS